MGGAADGPVFHIEFAGTDYGLRAWATGVNGSLETTLACWRTIAEEVRRQSPRGLLVVDDMEGEPPPPDQRRECGQARQGQGMGAVRSADVVRQAEQIPQVEVAGLLANEHGFEARIFADETTAALGLRYGER